MRVDETLTAFLEFEAAIRAVSARNYGRGAGAGRTCGPGAALGGGVAVAVGVAVSVGTAPRAVLRSEKRPVPFDTGR